MKRLARIWDVRVQAGIAAQSGTDWLGTVVEATPSGAILCTTGASV